METVVDCWKLLFQQLVKIWCQKSTTCVEKYVMYKTFHRTETDMVYCYEQYNACASKRRWSQWNFCAQWTTVQFLSTANCAVLIHPGQRESFVIKSKFKHSHSVSVRQLCCCANGVYVPVSGWKRENDYHTVNTCTVSLSCELSRERLDLQTD